MGTQSEDFRDPLFLERVDTRMQEHTPGARGLGLGAEGRGFWTPISWNGWVYRGTHQELRLLFETPEGRYAARILPEDARVVRVKSMPESNCRSRELGRVKAHQGPPVGMVSAPQAESDLGEGESLHDSCSGAIPMGEDAAPGKLTHPDFQVTLNSFCRLQQELMTLMVSD